MLVASVLYISLDNDYSLHAPAVQYGLLTRSTSLLCDVTSNISDIYSIMWTNPSGNEISGTIGPLTLAHEGQYKCEVFFADIGVLTNTFVQLVVLGECVCVCMPHVCMGMCVHAYVCGACHMCAWVCVCMHMYVVHATCVPG